MPTFLANLLLASCTPAVSGGADTAQNGHEAGHVEACTPAGIGGNDAFLPASHPAGEAWVWREDADFCVVLAPADEEAERQTSFGRGAHLLYGDKPLGIWSERPWLRTDGCPDTAGWLPVFDTPPRTDGTPVVLARDEGLVLALEGSAEHGCPAHDLTLALYPAESEAGLAVTALISGVPYLLLPRDGWVAVTDAAGAHMLFPSEMSAGESVEFSDMSSLFAMGTSAGDLFLVTGEAVPWFEVTAAVDFIELDMDHSCEQGMIRPELALFIVIPPFAP